MVRMTLGDAFNRRKKLASDLASWTNRLRASGTTRRTFRAKSIEGAQAFTPEPSSEKTTSSRRWRRPPAPCRSAPTDVIETGDDHVRYRTPAHAG